MEEQLQKIILQNDEIDPDLALLICLHEADADGILRELVPGAIPEMLGGLADSSFRIESVPAEPISISRLALESRSEEISEVFITQMNRLVADKKYDLAVGWIQYCMSAFMRSLFRKALNLNAIYNQANRIRGSVATIASNLGAHEFTLEFSVGLSTGITIGFHFRTPKPGT